jgi:hypothetical protein
LFTPSSYNFVSHAAVVAPFLGITIAIAIAIAILLFCGVGNYYGQRKGKGQRRVDPRNPKTVVGSLEEQTHRFSPKGGQSNLGEIFFGLVADVAVEKEDLRGFGR